MERENKLAKEDACVSVPLMSSVCNFSGGFNMFGAIVGDVLGSVWEFHPVRTGVTFEALQPRCKFTDDSVLTFATADVLLNGGDYGETYRRWGRAYPGRGYGRRFGAWLASDSMGAYNSLGNGSAMRVAPVGWAFETLDETLEEAKRSAECTHNHPEGVKGAQATAALIFLARQGENKSEMKKYAEKTFEYDLSRSIDEVRKTSRFDETCPISVPEAFICFFEADSFEETVRNAISLRADADTQACIAGGIAEAFWREIPEDWRQFTRERLEKNQLELLDSFSTKYCR